ncbi:dihydrofolate reductase [Erwinia phage AH06]|nr:dihydrofolate reductase [Erwinia phage AH06]
MYIQDMTFRIHTSISSRDDLTNVIRLLNQNDEVIIEHTLHDAMLSVIYQNDKLAAAYLAVVYMYTRDMPEGQGAATYDFHRTAGIILDQFVEDSNLGEFEADDWGEVEVMVPNLPEGVRAFVHTTDGSDVNIRIYRNNGPLVDDRLWTFTDEDVVPAITTLLEGWDADLASNTLPSDTQDNSATLSYGDVHFVYALDMTTEGRTQRRAIMQIIIGERLVAEQRIHENTQPLMYFVMEVFNMLALRFNVGQVAGINAEDRVTLLNAISAFIGGHLAMPDQVQIAAGMQYMHEGSVTDEVTYVLSHQLLENNQLRATYQFNVMVDETMRRSITMVDTVDYLQNPMTPLEFFNNFQEDLRRELQLKRSFDIAMIAAIDTANGLGKDGDLLFRINEDLQYFKSQTEYNPIIMGRKTYESLPHPLPNRLNIVLTTNPVEKHTTMSGVRFVNSKEDALAAAVGYLSESGGDKIWIIGGASVYELFLQDAKEIHLTTIAADREDADTFFPAMSMSGWTPERMFDEDQFFTREGEEISYNRYIMKRN